jgi:competence protein ComEC
VQQLPELPSLWWALLPIPLAWAAWRRPVWLIPLFFVGGVVWVSLRAGLILDDALAHELEGRDILVEGFVADIPQAAEYGSRFEFRVTRADHDGRAVRLPRRLLLSSSREHFVPRAGEAWRLEVRLARPHGFRNPGGFDYEGHLFRQRLRARGYVRAGAPPVRLEDGPGWLVVDRVRQQLGERIRGALPDNAYAGIVVALANGDARGIDEDQWRVLRATGTVHLVAISGLHISLVGGIVFFLARFLWALPGTTVLRAPAPVVGAGAALVAATAYAALAGFVVPAQRALIMLAVALGGVMWRRRFPPSQLLAAALLLVLLHDPLAVMAAGFWLSFAAVAVIILAVHGEPARRSWLCKWGYVQWAIALGMLPLLLALFQQVSLVAPLANMLAVPVFDMAAVPLTLAGIVASALLPDAAASALFRLAAGLLETLWPVLAYLGDLRFSQWTQHEPPPWAIFCALVGVALLLAPRAWPARWVGAVWLLPLFLVRPPPPAEGEVWFTLLDVGQGLSAVVRTRAHVLVYDAGPRLSPAFDTGQAVVVPYLRARGVGRIDTLVISHGDNDHKGGAESVLQALPVDRVLSSVPDLPFAVQPCVAGATWRWDGVEFTMLNPPPARSRRLPSSGNGGEPPPAARTGRTRRGAQHNDASCVLAVRGPHGAVLLPGDIEARAERQLLENFDAKLAADILVAPHHGSRTSSTEAFLEAVRPAHVLYPVGYRNRYRHPHPDVVERYARRDAQRHDSPTGGALEFRLGADGIGVSAFRRDHRRYWHEP